MCTLTGRGGEQEDGRTSSRAWGLLGCADLCVNGLTVHVGGLVGHFARWAQALFCVHYSIIRDRLGFETGETLVSTPPLVLVMAMDQLQILF